MKTTIFAGIKGHFIPLENISDPTFASLAMGPGFAVEPVEGVVCAPADATVTMTFPTGHAVGLTCQDGTEILIHIGIDTVNLNGKGFKILVNKGDLVKAKDELVRFDLNEIRKAGYHTPVMTIFTNTAKEDIRISAPENVEISTPVAEVERKAEAAQTESAPIQTPSAGQYQYGRLCDEILVCVGGKENLSNVFHCVTRLRIVPKDRSKVDMDRLKQVKGLLQIIEGSGQIQCVVGTEVGDVFNDFIEISGFKDSGVEDLIDQAADGKKENILMRGLNTLASCVTPGLWAIVAGGMIKGIVAMITAFHLVAADSDIITVLNALGDAPFYFMPFIIGFAAAQRFKVKEIFGILIAGILMYPTFLSPAEGITGYSFGLFNIPCYNYKNSIFPVILSVWLFSIVFHFINKRMPKNLRIVFSGALSLLITGPLFLGFMAPLGNWAAVGMTSLFGWLFNNVGPLAGALFAGIIPLTIIFGIKGWSALELQNIATLGYDFMLPNFFYSNLAVSGAVLGYALNLKKGEEKSAAISTGLVCILGITEPALYGIALPEKKPLYAAMLGGAVAGALAMILHVVTYSFSMPGITSIATYFDDGNNFIMLLIVMAVAWTTSFLLSIVLNKKAAKKKA